VVCELVGPCCRSCDHYCEHYRNDRSYGDHDRDYDPFYGDEHERYDDQDHDDHVDDCPLLDKISRERKSLQPSGRGLFLFQRGPCGKYD